jgi:hypothetical protein
MMQQIDAVGDPPIQQIPADIANEVIIIVFDLSESIPISYQFLHQQPHPRHFSKRLVVFLSWLPPRCCERDGSCQLGLVPSILRHHLNLRVQMTLQKCQSTQRITQ